MAKKGGNSKAEAAKEKKSAVKNEKDRAAKAKEEEANAEQWSQGAKKNNKKESEAEKKVRRNILDEASDTCYCAGDNDGLVAGCIKTFLLL
jgi:hypothetical protein